MIEEELKQEAEKSLDKRLGTYAYIRKQDCYTNYVDGYIDGAEPREKRIKELEKENAELKETVIKMNNVITETFSNLTKAKEIIEKVAKMYRYSPRVDEIIEQAEQFLSEVEK